MRALPGLIAAGLAILSTCLWTFWGTAEMYYEGWGAPLPAPLVYLIPALICLLLTLIALTWPLVGGWLLVLIGGAFTGWWLTLTASRGGLHLAGVLSMFPVSGMLVLTGILFLVESRFRRRRAAAGWRPPAQWLRRNLRYVAAIGAPLLIVVATSAYFAPTLLARVDDGDRGARRIEGNGVTLVWAPQGPGWNWKQPWGGYPSWDHLALYGVDPVGIESGKPGYEERSATPQDMRATGLCRYLDRAGRTLLEAPADVWRLPTMEEIVASLGLHGDNAGCSWDGRSRRADCDVTPDKETPLWAPDEPPIYYWSANEFDARRAYYVSYQGAVYHQPKAWGNPRHGYRCVRPPAAGDQARKSTLSP